MKRRVELSIDELALEGVDPRDRDRVVASLERELGRRLTRGELPRGSRATVVGERARDVGADELGAHVARVITGGGEQ